MPHMYMNTLCNINSSCNKVCYGLEGVARIMSSLSTQHQHRKDKNMQARKRLRQSLVVPCQSTESRHPRETPVDHPPPRKEHKPSARLPQTDHLKDDSMVGRRPGGLLSSVTRIDPGQHHLLPGRLPHRFSQLTDLITILLAGRRHVQG